MVVLDIERPLGVSGLLEVAGTAPGAGRSPRVRPETGRAVPSRAHRSSWEPLSGDALLERLRITGRPRPAAHPDLVQRLRSVLESGLADQAPRPAEGRDGPPVSDTDPLPSPVLVTKERLHRALACDAHSVATGSGPRPFSPSLACGALIDVLFRQLVTVGGIGDPMTDGLAALAVDDHQADLRSWIDGLAGPERDEVRAEVERQAEGLRRRWPALDPGWLPRTQQAMRVRLADGCVELSARVDLAIGRPARDEASVAIVEVASGSRRVEHRADLHFYALIEALRSPAPPFVVATYYSRTGELDVDPVTDELLVGAARRTLVGTRRLRHPDVGAESGRGPSPWCSRCSILLEGDLGPWPVTGTVPDPVSPTIGGGR